MSAISSSRPLPPHLKCLVWDLDHTLWTGVLAEGDALALLPDSVALIHTLDQRGILQSIASRNDADAAWKHLQAFKLDPFFLRAQISWAPKSESIQRIANALNIGMDTIALVDDQAFEREEVQFHLPQVRTYDAALIANLAALPEFNPAVISPDASQRRERYQMDQLRQQAEADFEGSSEAFLRSLGMKLQLRIATPQDLDRLRELTLRTHQLNTTGLTFGQAELEGLLKDPKHEFRVIDLSDRFGSYGTIGLILIEQTATRWNIRLLLLSCRIMNRGIGMPLIAWIQQRARRAGVGLFADFLPTDRNRMMYLTYKLAGFQELNPDETPLKLRCDLKRDLPTPDYLTVKVLS